MVYYSAHIERLIYSCVLLFICLVNLKLLFMNIPVVYVLFTVAAHEKKIINHVLFCTCFSYTALRLNGDHMEISRLLFFTFLY